MSNSEKKKSQREFFKTIYNCLFGKDRGPRLPTFVWASSKSKLEGLLNIDD